MKSLLAIAIVAAAAASAAADCLSASGSDQQICIVAEPYAQMLVDIRGIDSSDRAAVIARVGRIKDAFHADVDKASRPDAAAWQVDGTAASALLAKLGMAIGLRNAKKNGFWGSLAASKQLADSRKIIEDDVSGFDQDVAVIRARMAARCQDERFKSSHDYCGASEPFCGFLDTLEKTHWQLVQQLEDMSEGKKLFKKDCSAK